jgi:hypothetical protein
MWCTKLPNYSAYLVSFTNPPRNFIFANLDGHYDLANNTDSPKLVYLPKFACACIRVMYM